MNKVLHDSVKDAEHVVLPALSSFHGLAQGTHMDQGGLARKAAWVWGNDRNI